MKKQNNNQFTFQKPAGKNSQQSVDDYKKKIEILRKKLYKLIDKNKQLEALFKVKFLQENSQQKQVQRIDIFNKLILFNKQATKIQALWRGYQQRVKFSLELERYQNDLLIPTSSSKQQNTMQSLNKNQQIMQKIYRQLKKRGMSLEIVFRCVDKDYKNAVLADDFKAFFNKLQLDLTNSEKSRFFYLLDEECTGYIRIYELYQCLAVYGIPTEQLWLRSVEQESLLNFFMLAYKNNILPEELFNCINIQKKEFVEKEDIQQFCLSLKNPISEKQLHSLFTAFDINMDGKIAKENINIQMKRCSKNKLIQEQIKQLQAVGKPATTVIEATKEDESDFDLGSDEESGEK